MERKPTVGRIVHYYPGNNDVQLPNNMPFAPAIITQVFNEGLNCNMCIFCDGGVILAGYSVGPERVEYGVDQFTPHWQWPPTV